MVDSPHQVPNAPAHLFPPAFVPSSSSSSSSLVFSAVAPVAAPVAAAGPTIDRIVDQF